MRKQIQIMVFAFFMMSVGLAQGPDSQSTDQLQLDWFKVSTLKNVREIYPQVTLEIIEKNAVEPNFTSQIGPLTHEGLQNYVIQILNKSGIKTTDKFNATSSNAPLSLNVTVFAMVRDDTTLPSYAAFIYTEAMQPIALLRNSGIHSFSRTWPMVPIGIRNRKLMLLTPKMIEQAVKDEVLKQLSNFIENFSAANPSMNIRIPETKTQNKTNESFGGKTPKVSVPDSELDSSGMETGKITRVQIEGGFWGILSDDGTKYDPIYLPDEFKIDGLQVKFKVKIRDDLAVFHMWGTIVEIVKIEKR